MLKRVGIDIDGTVTCPTSLLPFINEAFKLQLSLNDIVEYDLTKAVNVSPETFQNWFLQAEPTIYKESPLAEGAKQILDSWKDLFQLYYISARSSQLIEVTKNWFKHHDIAYHHIELIGTHDKISTAEKHEVDLFLEDKHDNAVAIHEALDIPVILFDTPYNRDPIPDGVIRVQSWQEANQWVTRLLETQSIS